MALGNNPEKDCRILKLQQEAIRGVFPTSAIAQGEQEASPWWQNLRDSKCWFSFIHVYSESQSDMFPWGFANRSGKWSSSPTNPVVHGLSHSRTFPAHSVICGQDIYLVSLTSKEAWTCTQKLFVWQIKSEFCSNGQNHSQHKKCGWWKIFPQNPMDVTFQVYQFPVHFPTERLLSAAAGVQRIVGIRLPSVQQALLSFADRKGGNELFLKTTGS